MLFFFLKKNEEQNITSVNCSVQSFKNQISTGNFQIQKFLKSRSCQCRISRVVRHKVVRTELIKKKKKQQKTRPTSLQSVDSIVIQCSDPMLNLRMIYFRYKKKKKSSLGNLVRYMKRFELTDREILVALFLACKGI